MKIIAQSLILVNLGNLAASQSEQSYLRRRAKAIKETGAVDSQPEFKAVKPLLATDVLQITPSDDGISEKSGITLSQSSYKASDAVAVEFTVSPEYYVNAEVEPNLSRADDWTVGIYMHMADPQDGDLPPIVSLRPTFNGRDDNIQGSVTFGSDTLHLMEGSDPSWPLDTVAYGLGFDVWLLDEMGAAIIGPEWFTMESPPEEAETNNFIESGVYEVHPLVEYGHADTKEEFYDEEVVEEVSTFDLSANKNIYTSDERIQVSYTIGEPFTPTSVDEDSMILFDAPIQDEIMTVQQDQFISQDSTMEPQGLFDASFESKEDADFDVNFSPQQKANQSKEPSYTIAVYMKMARPQGGELEPIISKSADAKSGRVQFDASSLDTLLYGTGFDLWIIDEDGNGIYGPVFFSIPDPNDETPVMTSY